MTAERPSSVLVPAASLLTGAILLGLLSACSSGTTGSSWAAGTTVPAAGSTAAVPATAPGTTTAPAAETTFAPPVPLSPHTPVATDVPRPQKTDVVLSFVGWDTKTSAVEAGGYLSPVVESGGTCTLELSNGSRTVTAVSPAQADASTTSCGDLAVPRAQLTPGSWSAVLRYSSKTTTGTSDPVTVAVPQ